MQRLIGEILVLDLVQACFAEAVKIGLEAFTCDELILTAYLFREAISITNIVQDGEEDDEQFFVEVDAALLVNGIQVNGLSILHNGIGRCYRACPVDLVQSAMLVLHDEEEKALVVAVELYQRQQNVKIRIAQTT